MVGVASSIETIEEKNFVLMFPAYFDVAVAFSVFTHLNPADAANSLSLLKRVLRPGGRAVLTWFLDHPGNPDDCRVFPGTEFRERYPDSPSDFSIHTLSSVLSMTHDADFSLERVSFGYWRGGVQAGFKGQHYQDLTVLTKR
jgi:SAM-dependent methyltransferase